MPDTLGRVVRNRWSRRRTLFNLRLTVLGVSMPHTELTVTLGELIESDLKNPANKFTYINANRESSSERSFFRVQAKFKPMFAIQTWHKLYAGALMETDTIRLSLFLVVTEEAILARYIQLIADETESDEIADLQNAIEMLSQLREANQIGHAASQFVA